MTDTSIFRLNNDFLSNINLKQVDTVILLIKIVYNYAWTEWISINGLYTFHRVEKENMKLSKMFSYKYIRILCQYIFLQLIKNYFNSQPNYLYDCNIFIFWPSSQTSLFSYTLTISRRILNAIRFNKPIGFLWLLSRHNFRFHHPVSPCGYTEKGNKIRT